MELIGETGAFDVLACPLCAERALSLLLHDAGRRYFRCTRCDLISVHPLDRPTAEEESRRYLAHQNDATNEGYVRFLQRLADPLCALVEVGSHGIDIGCGPVPVLARLLTERGRPTQWYDPLFFPQGGLIGDSFGFVTCSEVIEHAHDPAALFRQLVSLLRPGGTLGVMTSMHHDAANFDTWWYRRDITHVCFYSERTMQWLARRFDLALSLPATNVALFSRRVGER